MLIRFGLFRYGFAFGLLFVKVHLGLFYLIVLISRCFDGLGWFGVIWLVLCGVALLFGVACFELVLRCLLVFAWVLAECVVVCGCRLL